MECFASVRQTSLPGSRSVTPVRYFIIVIVSILLAETFVMFAIHLLLPSQPLVVQAMIDGFLLVFLLFPCLYIFVLSPLLNTITAHKLAEERLRASEQIWEDTFNTITSTITIHDQEFNIVKANRAAETLLGLSNQRGTGIKCHAYFHGTDTPPENCATCQALKEGKEVTEEFFEPYLNLHLEVRAIPKFDSSNRVNGLIHVVRDITARKCTELALHESNQKFKTLFQAAPVAIFVLDTSGKVTQWNAAAERIFGWKEEEVVGKHYPLIPAEAGKEHASRFRKLMSGESLCGVDVQQLRRDGSRVDVSLFWAPLLDAQENVCSAMGVAMDISSRIEAETALKESKEQYRRLVEFSPYGIAIHDGERFTFVNNAGAAILGANTPDEVYGRSVIDFVHPDEREAGEVFIKEVVTQGKVFPRIEMRITRMDGKIVDVEMAAIPFIYQYKMAVHLIATDVSERKRAEEQLRLSLIEKEVLVKELHHRVKNNLQVVYALLGLQSRYLKDARDIDVFMASQNRIRTMAFIHEELYLSENLAQIDFAAYIKRLSAHLFESYGPESFFVELQATAGPNMLDIEMAVPCGLIVNELVCNSLKHAFPQQDAHAAKVCIDLKKEFDRFVLRVRDNGIGLPERIDFDNATSLGFRLVKILANQIGASIDVQREMGTEFIIQFSDKRGVNTKK